MTLEKHIKHYLENPLPLWDTEFTKLLVEDKMRELSLANSSKWSYEYSITRCINSVKYQAEISIPLHDTDIKLVLPSSIPIPFYEEHGLELAEINATPQIEIFKIKSALDILKQVPEVYSFITTIVKSFQILKAEDTETDISYSHPDIPFSIFFSLCEENNLISDYRIAESILHEAMHLKLTLIENHLDLIEPNSKTTFYSPWRDENRPLRGVLHGLFVFKALLDFFEIIIEASVTEKDYIESRVNQISDELSQLKDFALCSDLTTGGAILSKNLLPLN